MARIALLNPNATATMTRDMEDVARAAFGEAVTVLGYTNAEGPPAIQGAADADAALPGLFAAARKAYADGAEALIVGCFDDTGLMTLRAEMPCPVVGLGEAGCLAASLHSPRFAVLTTTRGSVPVIEANLAEMGLAPRCVGVIASDVPVLDLGEKRGVVRAALERLCAAHPEASVVLGCAGMSAIAEMLRDGLATPLIDPTRAATGMALAALQARVSGAGQVTLRAPVELSGIA